MIQPFVAPGVTYTNPGAVLPIGSAANSSAANWPLEAPVRACRLVHVCVADVPRAPGALLSHVRAHIPLLTIVEWGGSGHYGRVALSRHAPVGSRLVHVCG